MKFASRPLCACAAIVLFLPAGAPLLAGGKEARLSDDDKVEILRGLMAEYAKTKVNLPRSKKPLPFDSTGQFDYYKWKEMGKDEGPAARVGDLVQITKITFEGDKIVLELNGGIHHGSWKDHIQIGMGNQTRPISQGQTVTTAGTYLAIDFHKPVPPIDSDGLKKMLAPIFNFDKNTAVKSYLDTLPPEQQQAIKDKRAIKGMDRDGVLLALGKPRLKDRETTADGLETEDWIYGEPPGKVIFVTFAGSKVIKVREAWASIEGSSAAPLPPN
ncbi:MAG TPA: hypothetical protein VFA04_14490 [Bryobacteraceae bacterium]|nr:hypothetical protein [Bryobacteraceae bacterium]